MLELTADGKKVRLGQVEAHEPAQEPETNDSTTDVGPPPVRETFYELGVLKDRYPGEKRVALVGLTYHLLGRSAFCCKVPSICAKMYEKGYAIYIEKNAGAEAGFSDAAYEAVGCVVLPDSSGVCAKAKVGGRDHAVVKSL